MKNMNLPDTQELIWFAIGIWVTFFAVRMLRARHNGIASVLMYFFLGLAPPAVVIFQDQFVYWLQELRAYSPQGN